MLFPGPNEPMRAAAQLSSRFEVLGPLSTNLLTTIHRARLTGDEGFERPVAVKRLRMSAAAELARVEAFVEEAKIGASLGHPNLVETYALEAEGDRPFIAMELVDGESVAAMMARPRAEPLPAWWCVHVAMEVLAALDHMHRAGPFVHGDVGPHNVLIGRGGAVKLSDFGSAHPPRQARRLAVPGHAAYRAPERADGPADVAADLFSVGVLLWEMLAGRRLFDASSSSALARQIRTAPRPPPSRHRPDVSPALDAIVLTTLEAEVEHRVASAFDLRQHLGAVLDALHGTVRRAELVATVERFRAPVPEEAPRARPPTPPRDVFTPRPAEDSDTAYSVIKKRPSSPEASVDDLGLLELLLCGPATTRAPQVWVRDQHFTEVGPMTLAGALAHLSRMSETGRRSAVVSIDHTRWARFDRVLGVLGGPFENCPPMNGSRPLEDLEATLERERPTGTVVAMRATPEGIETAIVEVADGVLGRDVGPQAWLASSSQVLQSALFDDAGLIDAIERALQEPSAMDPRTIRVWRRFERARDLLLARRAQGVLEWTSGSFGLSSGPRVDSAFPRV